jgi:hypothetical protein
MFLVSRWDDYRDTWSMAVSMERNSTIRYTEQEEKTQYPKDQVDYENYGYITDAHPELFVYQRYSF